MLEVEIILQILKSHDFESKPDINWELIYQFIIRHRIWYQAAQSAIFSHMPNNLQKKLEQYCNKNKFQLIQITAETARIAKALQHQNLQHCFIKGVVLNQLLYPTIYARPCKDIDVWVASDDYDAAILQLKNLNYKQIIPNYELTNFKKRYYMTHKHDFAFYNSEKKILIELHFRLDYFGINFFTPKAAMLKDVDIFNTKITTLDNDYHLLYLMIHGAIHAWIRLRWLNDIGLFIQTKQCNLQNVMQLAKQINCEHIVKQSLILVRDVLDIDFDLVFESNKRIQVLVDLAKQFIYANYEMHESINNIRMFVKYRYYLARLAVKKQKFNAIIGDLFKIDMLFEKVTLPDKLGFIYYILYVWWGVRFVFRKN
jgi:hypothetical protein